MFSLARDSCEYILRLENICWDLRAEWWDGLLPTAIEAKGEKRRKIWRQEKRGSPGEIGQISKYESSLVYCVKESTSMDELYKYISEWISTLVVIVSYPPDLIVSKLQHA